LGCPQNPSDWPDYTYTSSCAAFSICVLPSRYCAVRITQGIHAVCSLTHVGSKRERTMRACAEGNL
jgi:hypothetical protein